MTSAWIRTLRNAVAATALMAFAGCSSLGNSVLPAGLTDALGQITGLSSSLTDWKSSLTGALDAAGIDKLQGFADQAGELGSTVTSFTDQVSAAAADPLAMIGSKLGAMGDFDASSLKDMLPAEQAKAVTSFTEAGSGVSNLVGEFIKNFGS